MGLAADRVNGARRALFTLSFTGPFTLKEILSHTEHKRCAGHEDESGRGQNTGLGWSDPTLDGLQPPKPLWGRSRPVTTER